MSDRDTASGASEPEGDLPDGYLSAHLVEALTEDARVAEPGLRVEVAGARVVVSGTVSDPERKEAVAEVLADKVGDRTLVNRTEVAGSGPPPQEQV